MPSTSVVVTGMGLVSALGCGADKTWRAMRAGATGLGPLTRFPSSRCGHFPVGEVKGDPAALGAPPAGSRSDQLAHLAVREALESARLAAWETARLARTGIVVGATVGGIQDSERFLAGLIRDKTARFDLLTHHAIACSAAGCARTFGLGGPCATVSTACASGATAIAMAGDLLEAGEADVVVATGVDTLCGLTLNGFGSLLLLDPEGCRPFDAERAGLSLGEGAAALVLEPADAARRRGAPVLARLAGWGRSCDAHHMTAPDPEGRGALSAMRDAIARAGLSPADIDYVNAHGTGTRDNDVAEAKALRRLFGDRLPPVSSSKGWFGHTLAACGAIEAVVTLLAIRDGLLPPNPRFSREDPEIGITPVTAFREAPVRHALSNSFGFGGNNAALVFASADADAAAVPTTPTPSAPLAVLGIGVVSPAGTSSAEVAAAARGALPAPATRKTAPPLPEADHPVRACPKLPEARRLPPARRRRLSRLLEMTITAARDAAAEAPSCPPEETAVLVGTGLGCLEDTVAFLRNRIENDERNPMPARFIHSVHNALASRTAIEVGARRMNGTTVQNEVSFEAALWQARRLIERGEARRVLVGAADELNDCALAAREHWRRGDKTAGVPPGEVAAMVALGPDDPAATARVAAVALGRLARDAKGDADIEAECDWIGDVLSRAGQDPRSMDLLLVGAGGTSRNDDLYAAVAEALGRRRGRPIPVGAYKPLCGDACAASAFGFVVAAGVVGGKIPPRALLPDPARAGADADRPARRVLLYTLDRDGAKGLCCVLGRET
jgi:3-oxoacyl-(acyl-carrier-protein) synthase